MRDLWPRSTVETFLFVWDLALPTDCETKARNCDIASFNGSILTSLFSLESFRSSLTLTILSLFTFEAK